jgi:hypothetical protein
MLTRRHPSPLPPNLFRTAAGSPLPPDPVGSGHGSPLPPEPGVTIPSADRTGGKQAGKPVAPAESAR